MPSRLCRTLWWWMEQCVCEALWCWLALLPTPHSTDNETSSGTTQHHTPTNLMHPLPLSHLLWMGHMCIFMRCHSTSPRRDATTVDPTGTQHLDIPSGPGLLERVTDWWYAWEMFFRVGPLLHACARWPIRESSCLFLAALRLCQLVISSFNTHGGKCKLRTHNGYTCSSSSCKLVGPHAWLASCS